MLPLLFDTHPRLRLVLRYLVAVGVVTLALLLQRLLDPLVDFEENPFLLFFAAVMISAWYGGFWAGLLATFFAALVSDYFFLSPYHLVFGNTIGQNLRLALFLFDGM